MGPSPDKGAFASYDPASAQRHFAPRRVRDDTRHWRFPVAVATHAIPPAHRRSLRDARPTGLTNDTTLDTMAVVRSASI